MVGGDTKGPVEVVDAIKYIGDHIAEMVARSESLYGMRQGRPLCKHS